VLTDAELLQAAVSGNRNAYAHIVERYKSLVCAIAYGITGDLDLSEDLAQETFLTAWRRLTDIRDTSKLRAWLCGIARNLSLLALRKRRRDVIAHGQVLDGVPEQATTAPGPRECAVSKEEAELLWRAIEAIPESYRIPLILYYREGESVQRVAASMGISAAAAKQRLFRGRRMLRDEVASMVERSLARTRPSQRFTLGVVAALPAGRVAGTVARSAATRLQGGRLLSGASWGAQRAVLACAVALLGVGAGVTVYWMGAAGRTEAAIPQETHAAAAAEESVSPRPEPEGRDPVSGLSSAAPQSTSLQIPQAEVPARATAPAGYPGTVWRGTPGDSLVGAVYDPAGNGLPAAKVAALRYGSGALQVFECLTDTRGRYRLRLPPGQWCVQAYKGTLGGEAGPELWGQVITEGRDATIDKTIHTEKRGILRGRVLDKITGLPVRSGRVYAQYEGSSPVVVPVDGEGRYELEGLPMSVHYVAALCPGYERAIVITSTLLRKEARLDLRVARAVMATGVVMDTAGRPLAHAWVARDLLKTGNSLYHYEVCDEQGRFEYDGLPFGERIRLTAQYPCYGNVCAVETGPEAVWVGVPPSEGAIELVVDGRPAGEVCAYRRGEPPAPEGAICGRVLDPEGRPLRDFQVFVQWPHSGEAGAHPEFISIDYWTRGFSFTSPDGVFALGFVPLRPGQVVRVAATAEGYGQAVRDEVLVSPFTRLPSPGTLELRLGSPGTLAVRVLAAGPAAMPIAGAEVRVVDTHPVAGGVFHWDDIRKWRSVALETDDAGWARFTGIAMTAGTVIAEEQGYGKGRVEWRNGEAMLPIVLSRACRMEGTLLDHPMAAGGRPVPLGLVKLERLPTGVYASKDKAIESFEAKVEPEDEGEFRLDALPPGFYRLTAHWWRGPNRENVSYADEFLLDAGEVLRAVYPDNAAFENPARWLVEGAGDPRDEALREALVGVWYHDIEAPDGTGHRAVYCFAEDGCSESVRIYAGRPAAPAVHGYFKICNGSLKMVEQDRSPLDTTLYFSGPDTLLLGWMNSEPPLQRAASLEDALGE